MREILSGWAIPMEKVTAVVTDGAANIVATVNEVFGNSKQLHCFAHSLNHVLSSSIESINSLAYWKE